jgi:acyl-CoA synthetase (AMP-forming)/AMP-acid ligase II
MNTTEFLNITSLIAPDRTAIVFDGKRISYSELSERVNRLANGLANLGVIAGDRVATMQVNCNEYIEAYFASAKLDAVFVPLNFRAIPDEIEFMVKDSGPKVFICGSRYMPMMDTLKPNLPSLEHLICLDGANQEGWINYDELIIDSLPDEIFPSSNDEDLTMLMFTAGTTGSPKGVMLTHESFSSYILNNVSPAELDVEEKNILTVPLYHIAGVQAVIAAIYGGRTLIIQRQFEPAEWMTLVQTERANRAMMVPTMLKMLMDHEDFEEYDLTSLQVITYGAASMPLEVIKMAIRKFPDTYFINAFGQTETAATITMLPPEDHILEGTEEEIEIKLNRLTSIGKPLPDVDVKIVNEEGGDVDVGDTGEIVASGGRLMKGYWNQEAATAQALRGGWLYTGDLGYFDEDGYIYLSGRAKDFIKRGGEMVSPEEVEQILHSHPMIDEAAIIGIPDLSWGERVRAIVVPKPGETIDEKEVIEYCRSRMSGFKRPESVIIVDELPRNPLGKVLKRVLREQYNDPIVN